MHIVMRTQFKVTLTPNSDNAAYSQYFPLPIHFNNYFMAEVPQVETNWIKIVLPVSKWKINGKLRLLVEFQRINSLISNEYVSNQTPVSTLFDAAKQLAGKSLICNFQCSQAYDCIRMVIQHSMGLVAFIFAHRTLPIEA